MIVNGGGRIRQRGREKAEDFAGGERQKTHFHHRGTEARRRILDLRVQIEDFLRASQKELANLKS